jgi:hypothetical protein
VSAIVVTSAVNHRRIGRARSWLENRLVAEEVLIIGASLDAAKQGCGGERRCFRVASGDAASARSRARRPLLAERKLVPISRLGAEAIVARVVHRLKAEAGLGRYQPVGDTPGFAPAIAAVIAELRLGSVTSGAISKVAPDLMRLMEAYEASLAEAELADWPGVLNLATETASGHAGAHRLMNLPMLLLDVSIRSQAELAFLRAVSAAARDILATVPAGDQATLGQIRDGPHWKFEVSIGLPGGRSA